MEQIVEISGMSCGGCVKSVEKALQTIDGVETAKVTLNPPQANLQTDQKISDDQMNIVLSAAGKYSVAKSDENEPKKSGGSCCC
jgi:copper chaperone